nr:hypothetical protein [Kribbella qitaiheensis]
MDLCGQPVDLAGEFGVRPELLLLRDEVVVGLRLLERGLPVLPDHHKGRQEDRLERDDQGEFRPRIRLEHQHPEREQAAVQVDEGHRSGERRDRVGDPQLQIRRPGTLVGDDHRMMPAAADQVRAPTWR